MPKQFLPLEDHLAMLNEYAPHKVEVAIQDVDGVMHRLLLVGVDFKANMALLDSVCGVRPHAPNVFQPVLYSLADLPNLPGGDGRDYASPVASIIHALNFIQRGDEGSGEWVRQVTVKSGSDARLHLAFSTSLTHESAPTNFDDDDDDEFYMNPENFVGADYEVIIEATGTVHWRCVTADNLDMENRSRGLGFVQHWRIAEGTNVFEAFTMMRRLHVAVGLAAYVHHTYNGTGYDKHYSYVRKQLPMVAQEGGQQHG